MIFKLFLVMILVFGKSHQGPAPPRIPCDPVLSMMQQAAEDHALTRDMKFTLELYDLVSEFPSVFKEFKQSYQFGNLRNLKEIKKEIEKSCHH